VDPAELKPGMRWRAYHPRLPIGWVRGTDLSSGDPVFVPRVRLSLDSIPTSPDADILGADSNGLASGNDRWEALCHGLFEVIERDCDWRWCELSPAARQQRLLDNDTIESPLLQSYLARCASAGVVPRIWDITSDVGIPAYRCILRDEQSWRPLGADYGAGCHLSREIALARAITEAAQCRLTFIAGARDDIFPSVYERRRAQWSPGSTAPLPPGAYDFRSRLAPPPPPTFEAAARDVVGRLVAAGHRRVVAVDHTKPDLGVPVVHVVVPGLRCAK
jgi:ribosomal protein S12 methylthiotransferase accessory factor